VIDYKLLGSRTCKPNSVCRFRQDGHSSGPRITAGLKRPTRRWWRTEPARAPVFWSFLPIWSCSVWGLPCPLHYCGGGALLPHLFTLTGTLRPGGMFSVALSVERSRPWKRGRPPGRYPAHCPAEFGLSSVLRQRPPGPAANRIIIFDRLRPRTQVSGRRSQARG